jgi:hypothetical protein
VKKIFSEAFEKASKKLASEMSSQLTQNAQGDGWPSSVAQGLTVQYDQGTFNMGHAPEHSTMVFDLEYGTETNAPKGTLRKMHNSTKELTNRFATLYEKYLVKL